MTAKILAPLAQPIALTCSYKVTNFQRKCQICAQCISQEVSLNLKVQKQEVILQAKPDWLLEQLSPSHRSPHGEGEESTGFLFLTHCYCST